MELLDNMGLGFSTLLGINNLLAVVVGVAIGIVIGVLPGLSASTGVALLLSFTWFLDPTTALVLFGAMYTAAQYGGAITAIAINTPGEPSAVCTAMDGYPLTLQGRMGEALTVSIVMSVIGGIFGTIVLILFAPTLAEFALVFGAPEYVALGVLGLTLAAALSSGDFVKGGLTTLFGLLLATFGQDPIGGSFRFTFGVDELIDGIALIPALIGLFAMSEVLIELVSPTEPYKDMGKEGKGLGLKGLWGLRRSTTIGSVLGVVIGVVPGAGATIASFVSYAEARRFSKTPELFGKGSLEGVAAAESANNSCVGGALVPMLTLGIPGSGTTAVMMGALIMHGLQPGPELFANRPDLVYGLFAALLAANVVMLGIGLAGVNFWLFSMRMPKPYLMALIIVLCFIGAYGDSNSLWSVGQMLIFGVIGYFLKRHKFPVATVVLGLVLGPIIESNLRRAVLMQGWGSFVHSPLALMMLIVAAATVAVSVYRASKGRREGIATLDTPK